MKNMTKKILLSVSLMLVLSVQTIFAAGWTQVDDNWQYIQKDETPVLGEQKKIDGSWYYFDNDGFMVKDQLVELDSDYYYFGEDGKRVAKVWKKLTSPVDGETYWYYFRANGKAFKNGWTTLDGKKYHFTDCNMDTGWYKDGEGNTYYLNGEDEGYAESGWLPYKGNDEKDIDGTMSIGWYYFDPDTNKMVSDAEKKIGKSWYAFNEDGVMVGGFAYVKNKTPISNGNADKYILKYYDELTGARVNGWRYVEESATDAAVIKEEGWYYFKDGVPYSTYSNTKVMNLTTGFARIDGDYYAFDVSGKMLKGLVLSESDTPEEDNLYYYFGDDGKMQVGYVDIVEDNGIAPAEKMYFATGGVTVPRHGASVTGVVSGKVYDNGVLQAAERERFELITISNGNSYVVSEQGSVQSDGAVVKLYTGRKMKVKREGDSYTWYEVK